MPNSNEEIGDNFISNGELERINRRLDLSKGFFAWALMGYFLSSLFSVGGYQVEIASIVSKGLLGVLLFGCGALLYSLYTYHASLSGKFWYGLRFLVLPILMVIFGIALLRNYGFLPSFF